MSKTKKPSKVRDAYPKLPVAAVPAPAPQSHAIRETVESIVIAFVLAFLFRTFEAEAFVIPTGSMAPTLMGRHKDVECDKCGHRFQVNSSVEEQRPGGQIENAVQRQFRQDLSTCIAGMCPMCRHVMPLQANLPSFVPERLKSADIENQSSYNGDRILVNKYDYTLNNPERWDVVVFKFPGNAQVNYIKRLVGLPNEVIRIYEGDLFTAPAGDGKQAGDFKIAAKPADKVLAMRQLVHDTDYDPTELYNAGWPLRWEDSSKGAAQWQTVAMTDGRNVGQKFTVDAGNDTAWLRYRHTVPSYETWQQLDTLQPIRAADVSRLITDFNAYNTRVSDASAKEFGDLRVDASKLGLHWVGDLMVAAEVAVESNQGEMIVDLVEAGQHFTATFDLATGRAVLGCAGLPDFAPAAITPLKGPGKYRVALANFDDQLLLWVDDKLIDFDGATHYDAVALWGDRESIIPHTSDDDPGDLAPVGIGARNAKLAVTHLQVWRDIYYIADRWNRQRTMRSNMISDFDDRYDGVLASLPSDPSRWDLFRQRRQVEFPLGDDQFFVMGDNSPESSDARLWLSGDGSTIGKPGGAYLERDLLIGKALSVYWPHSWNQVPGTPIPFPLFPNVEDMRLVR